MVWWKKKLPAITFEEKKKRTLEDLMIKHKDDIAAWNEAHKECFSLEKLHKALFHKNCEELSEEIRNIKEFQGALHYSLKVKNHPWIYNHLQPRYYFDSGYKKELLQKPYLTHAGKMNESFYEARLKVYSEKVMHSIELPFWVTEEVLGKEDPDVLRNLPWGNFKSSEYLELTQKMLAARAEYFKLRKVLPEDVRLEAYSMRNRNELP